MTMTVLLCTDGSDLATNAIRHSLELLATPDRIVVLAVASAIDPTLVTGTGFAGGVMTFDEKNDIVDAQPPHRNNTSTTRSPNSGSPAPRPSSSRATPAARSAGRRSGCRPASSSSAPTAGVASSAPSWARRRTMSCATAPARCWCTASADLGGGGPDLPPTTHSCGRHTSRRRHHSRDDVAETGIT